MSQGPTQSPSLASARNQALAVRREDNRYHAIIVPRERPLRHAAIHIPEPDGLIVTGCCQAQAVRRERDLVMSSLWPARPIAHDRSARPRDERSCPAAARQTLAVSGEHGVIDLALMSARAGRPTWLSRHRKYHSNPRVSARLGWGRWRDNNATASATWFVLIRWNA